jgi:transcription antitermination factor NusG
MRRAATVFFVPSSTVAPLLFDVISLKDKQVLVPYVFHEFVSRIVILSYFSPTAAFSERHGMGQTGRKFVQIPGITLSRQMHNSDTIFVTSHTIVKSYKSEVTSYPLPWYALHVRCHAEKNVSRMLEGRGYEQYLPLYRERTQWSDRVKQLDLPLFPGYVFCRLEVALRRPVLTVPGVVAIVGFGSTFAPVPEDQISAVRDIVRSGLPSSPWPFLKEGQRIRVSTGSLEGVEGLLIQVKNEYRVVVSVPLLQRSVAVEIDRDCIQLLSTVRPS